jgi:hypothetical protein
MISVVLKAYILLSDVLFTVLAPLSLSFTNLLNFRSHELKISGYRFSCHSKNISVSKDFHFYKIIFLEGEIEVETPPILVITYKYS